MYINSITLKRQNTKSGKSFIFHFYSEIKIFRGGYFVARLGINLRYKKIML